MKPCVACGKKIPDEAINCVFCKARQREERLDPTPVRGIPHDRPPAEAVAMAEGHELAARAPQPDRPSGWEEAAPAKPAPAPAAKPSNGHANGVRAAAPTSDEGSVLIQLGRWNRNERASLLVAGLALLAAVVGFHDLRVAAYIAGAAAIVAAGVLPLPRVARGGLALAAGMFVLWRLWGWPVAFALPLLPGALLTRAREPANRVAQAVALLGAAAIVAAYLVPREGTSLYQVILSGFKGEHFIQIATAIYLTIPIPLAVVGFLAMTPRRTLGGCVLWASLLLLWAPVGLLLSGWWSISMAASVGAAVIALACSASAALGIADLASA